MRRSEVRPRVDQVAELTHGLRLPLEPIANDHLEVLAERLRQAFNDVRGVRLLRLPRARSRK